ncbi:MAG TPA: alpha/beta-hydrolase family protein [Stenotrophomonas sp.]|nr:alpha/beta-hydrolase family protein [Stenotrophomonas sp.]
MTEPAIADTVTPRNRLRRLARDARLRLGRRPGIAGMLFGTLFFICSLSPGLIPRGSVAQGLLSGFCLAVGYALGALLQWLWTYLQLPQLLRHPRLRHWPTVLLALCGVGWIATVWLARSWQNSVRAVMQMPPIDEAYSLRLLLVAVLTMLGLLLLGRLFAWVAALVDRRAQRVLPPRVANVIGVVAAVVLFALVANGVILRAALHGIDASFRQADTLTPPDREQPTARGRTGGPGSLVDWQHLGRMGRDFVSGGPTAADIAAHGGPAMLPVRVYVGLPAAPDAAARARLALRELQQQGGFSRSMLVIITPTGTGWVDPAAIDSLEYLQRGDVASVAVQYSYLSSPLSLMIEPGYGEESARALFQEVYGYWRSLPKAQRPRLYVHGLSLGAMNSERSMDLFELLGDPIDGALWSGPPFEARQWRSFTAGRNPGSPQWLPTFRDGRFVRFMNQHGTPVPAATPWGPTRVVYLQYASDAITFFDPHDAWRSPDWMAPPRAFDVSPDLRWYPLVSMFQLAMDMLLADSAPMGYGHVFAPSHYIDAWLLVTGARDWSPAQLQQLREQLDARRRAQIEASRRVD